MGLHFDSKKHLMLKTVLPCYPRFLESAGLSKNETPKNNEVRLYKTVLHFVKIALINEQLLHQYSFDKKLQSQTVIREKLRKALRTKKSRLKC